MLTGLVRLLGVLQILFCATLNAFVPRFLSFSVKETFQVSSSSGLHLDGMVLCLHTPFLQSHIVVEVNLREIGPACFHEGSRESFSSNAALNK